MPGLRWSRLDLHVHTPASQCFHADGVDISPQDIVETALAAGLDGVAITDHMSGEWVDAVKEAAQGTTLVVFPGVELSLQSYHVIALFPQEHSTKDIEGLLGACDVQTTNYGRTEVPITKDPEDVFRLIHARGGLTILAHIDCEHAGSWHTIGKANLKRTLFNSSSYDAIEVKGELPPEELRSLRAAKNKGFKRLPAWYRASDNPHSEDTTKHSLSGIGAKYSCFKGEAAFSLESLRQCFRDPAQRIRQSDEDLVLPHPCVTSLEIQGGFLDGTTIQFHEELTSVVGGKGVGKSLVVEFLRLALGNTPDIPAIEEDHRSKIAEQLGEDARVIVHFKTEAGTEYRATAQITAVARDAAGPSYECVRTVQNMSSAAVVTVNPSRIIPVTVFSQGEIVEISRRKAKQLLQLDSFVDLDDVTSAIEGVVLAFEERLDVLLACRAAREKVAGLKEESSTLGEQIAATEESLKADIFLRFKDYETAEGFVTKALAAWNSIEEPIRSAAESLREWEEPAKPDGLGSEVVSSIAASERQTRKEAVTQLEGLLSTVEKRAKQSKNKSEVWRKGLATTKEAYDEYIAETGTKETLSTKRGTLKKKLEQVEEDLKQAEREVGQWDKTWQEAMLLARELDDDLTRRFKLRSDKAADLTKLSRKLLRLSVEEASSRLGALRILKNVHSGLHTPTLQALVNNVASHHLVLLLLDSDYDCSPGIDMEQLERLTERVLALDSAGDMLKSMLRALPEDTPLIEYRTSKGKYSPVETVSQGQRCTALISLALLEGSTPVIIDQPEDSLDIRAVWDDIATSVRGKKAERQFIFTTHNSTIAVAADSDIIAVLEPAGARACKTHEGSIDLKAIKDSAIQHLEGGTEAYSLRRQKYNVRNDEG